MDSAVLKLVVNAVFDWLEKSQAGHPLALVVIRQVRKLVLANIGEVAAAMPQRVVAKLPPRVAAKRS